MYNKGYGEYLLLSGNKPLYANKDRISESLRYEEYALSHGVPKNKIITENESISIPDNIRSSLNLLDTKEIVYRNIILVNSPYAQRRGWCFFKKYILNNINLIRINSDIHHDLMKNSWYKNEYGIRVILSEFIKMKIGIILNTC